MTKLEEEIKAAISEALKNPKRASVETFCLSEIFAKAAAEVSQKYILKAFIDGYYAIAEIDSAEWPHPEKITGQVLAEKWLKENGIA